MRISIGILWFFGGKLCLVWINHLNGCALFKIIFTPIAEMILNSAKPFKWFIQTRY